MKESALFSESAFRQRKGKVRHVQRPPVNKVLIKERRRRDVELTGFTKIGGKLSGPPSRVTQGASKRCRNATVAARRQKMTLA